MQTIEFLGIPYALPPTGERRWHPPVDWVGSYEGGGAGGARDATRFGASCSQADDPNSDLIVPQLWNLSHTSEDCLFINVWRPTSAAAAAATAAAAPPAAPPGGPLLPVLFFVHGGGFTQGCADLYNDSALASKHGVVVVTLNYRLGALGFWPFAEELAANRSSGNYGLLDQQSGLRWVQKHAAQFGGDRCRVLLFGQSAGAASVAAHMAMPGSGGMFATAAFESGAAGSGNLTAALARTDAIGADLGCPPGPGRLACLRKVPAARFVARQINDPKPATGSRLGLALAAQPANLTECGPVADGIALPAEVRTSLLAPGGWPAGVPVLAGLLNDDAALFTVGAPPGSYSAANYSWTVELALHDDLGTPVAGELELYLQEYPPSAARYVHTMLRAYNAVNFDFCGSGALRGSTECPLLTGLLLTGLRACVLACVPACPPACLPVGMVRSQQPQTCGRRSQ